MKYLKCLFWNLVYLFRPRWRREPLQQYLLRGWRCRWPRDFKPSIWYNECGGYWEVYLSDDSYYASQSYTLPVAVVFLSQDDDRVVGFQIWDEHMSAVQNTVMQEKSKP